MIALRIILCNTDEELRSFIEIHIFLCMNVQGLLVEKIVADKCNLAFSVCLPYVYVT